MNPFTAFRHRLTRDSLFKYAVLHMNRDPWFTVVRLMATHDEWERLMQGLELLERLKGGTRTPKGG